MYRKIFKLHKRQVLPISLDKAWDYFSNPANLPEITPPQLGLELQGSVNAKIYEGMIIEYTVRPLLNIQLTWLTEIQHIREPYQFVDEQRVGPYKFWYHQHKFRSVKQGVEIEDLVYYALPCGILSGIINRSFVSRKLRFIFDYRKDVLKRIFAQ